MQNVRCSDCGFLALIGWETDTLHEANKEFRTTGRPTRPRDHLIYQDAPTCFVDAIDIQAQLKGRSYGEIAEGVRCERPCGSWVKWKPGHSPKEHLEMVQLEELRNQQREEAERNREFQAERDRQQQEQQRAQRRHQWLTLIVSLCGVGIAAFSAFKAKAPAPPPIVNVVLPSSPTDEATRALPTAEPDRQTAPAPTHLITVEPQGD